MSKFSSLMDYLDAQNAEESDGAGSRRLSSSSSSQHQLSAREPSGDSMPNTPPVYSSRRQYVWDEIENDRHQNQYSGSGSVSSRSQSQSSARRGDESHNKEDSSSIIQMAQAVKCKVDAMKVELRNRTESLKELQTELARVRNASERKQDKCIKMWENRLNDLSEEQNKVLLRQRTFLEKIENDMKDLRLKENALKDKIHLLVTTSEEEIRKILVTGQRKKERIKSQLIADEKKHFEKVLESKMENMKKIAAKSVGIKLDSLVTEYRESILRATEENEKKILLLESTLENDINEKFYDALEKIKVDKAHDIDRNRKAIDGSMSDGRKRQEEEIKLLKEKFQRARNILEEQEEFSRRKESLKFMSDLDNVRNGVEKQRRELNENHQRILSRTVRNNSEKKLKFEKQMNDENISWENNFRSQILKDQVQKKKKNQEILELKNAAETAKIIKRLKFEAEEERENIRKTSEIEKNRVQDDAYRATDILQISEKRSIELLKNMKNDVAKLKIQKEAFEKNDARVSVECSDCRNIIAAKKTTLKNAEASVKAADLKFKSVNDSRVLDAVRSDNVDEDGGDEVAEVKMLRERFGKNRDDREQDILTADTANEDEFKKIKEKVDIIVEKKTKCIKDSSSDISQLERECARLEIILEDLRNAEH